MAAVKGWQHQAACATPEHRALFLDLAEWRNPGTGGPSQRERTRMANAARTVCAVCPVLADCRDFANTHQLTAGMWAGKQHRGPL